MVEIGGGVGGTLEASPSASEVSGRALRHHQKLLRRASASPAGESLYHQRARAAVKPEEEEEEERGLYHLPTTYCRETNWDYRIVV